MASAPVSRGRLTVRALTVEEAVARIVEGVSPLEAEHVDLLDAHGRTLAADIAARLTQPPFDASAMDGYAVRKSDVAQLPARLTVIGEAAAGAGAAHTVVQPGQTVRIFTGAPLPQGADAVVVQENTRADTDGVVVVTEGTPEVSHIRRRGGDFSHGETLLKAGRMLDARALTLAAASGHAILPVRRRPTVVIIATGNELVAPGQTPAADQIVSSNPIGLASMLRAFGAQPRLLGIARDTMADLAAKLEEAGDADIVITTGGASVGDHDLVRPALEAIGVRLDFWKLAMRPGKPMIFGRRERQCYLGLPGNPVSAMITARVFAVPLVSALLGRPAADGTTILAATSQPIAANGARQHYMRASLSYADSRPPTVTPALDQDSSLLKPLAASNALIVRAIDAPPVPAGSMIPVLPLDF